MGKSQFVQWPRLYTHTNSGPPQRFRPARFAFNLRPPTNDDNARIFTDHPSHPASRLYTHVSYVYLYRMIFGVHVHPIWNAVRAYRFHDRSTVHNR